MSILQGCSCQTWNNFWGNGPVKPGCEKKLFFDKDCKLATTKPAPVKSAPKVTPKPKSKPVAKPVQTQKTIATTSCGPASVTMDYPCQNCSIIRLDKVMPSEVLLNSPFDYSIKVTNVTDMIVANVVVKEHIPGNLSIKETNPSANKDGDFLVWNLGTFAPKQSKQIIISGTAANIDCIKTCAAVTYILPACANVKVVQPALRLEKIAPAEALLCDPIPVKFIITNTGTGSAKNVKIEDVLPTGLETADGKNSLIFDAGTLASGQSRQFSATLHAIKTGEYVNEASASSSSGLKATAQAATIVRQAVLTITKTAPKTQYLGRSVSYGITVSNKGDAPAEDLVVEDQLPRGAKLLSISDGGKAVDGKIKWNLGTLAKGKARKLSVKVMPQTAGTFTNTVSAVAECAGSVKAYAKTVVAGIPAVLLEVVDLSDPIEVGNQTTYVITATNQGTAADKDISIVCTLEDNEKLISVSGSTRGTLKGNKITFAPLRSLAPKAQASWRVVVEAAKAGDVRFKVSMNTKNLDRPVEETEATRLYK